MQLAIEAYTATTALGNGRDALWDGLREGRSGLQPAELDGASLPGWVGSIPACMETQLPAEHRQWDCRNNRLAELAIQQDGFLQAVHAARAEHGASRIGLILGTSTSGIAATEQAYREARAGNGELPRWYQYDHSHDYFSLCGYLRERLGLQGHTLAISTACSSSAKVFASAARAFAAGYCDAAIVGGVDSLCLTTINGFDSLQLVSAQPCRPCDRMRNGISIGEAGGFALVRPATPEWQGMRALGWGESSDAHHMSSPDPDGRGAEAAMRRALQRAGVSSAAVDHVNLHGTGTPANDTAEALAVARVLGGETPCASTKGWTGHTLGAAGIVEAVIALQCIQNDWLPQTLHLTDPDPALPIHLPQASRGASVQRVLSNSFGFGGSNCSLLLGASA